MARKTPPKPPNIRRDNRRLERKWLRWWWWTERSPRVRNCEWYRCRPLTRPVCKSVKRRPAESIRKTRWVNSRDYWEDRRASQGVKMNGTIGVSSLEQLLRHCLSMQALWMSDALRDEYGNHSGSTEPGNGEDLCTTVVHLAYSSCVRDEHWHLSGEHQTTTVWKRGGCYTNGINRIQGRGAWRC